MTVPVQTTTVNNGTALTFPVNITAGNTVVVCVSTGNNTTVSPSSGTDSYLLAVASGAPASGAMIYYVLSSQGGYKTANLSVAADGWAYEVPRCTSLDKTSSSIGASPYTFNSGATATTTQASEFAVGVGAGNFNGSASTITGPISPWTNLSSLVQGQSIDISGYQFATSAGTFTYFGTVTGSGTGTSFGAVATFKIAALGAVTGVAARVTAAGGTGTLTAGVTAAVSGQAAAVTTSGGLGTAFGYTVFPGKHPNPLGARIELNLAGSWTDITQFVLLRDLVTISNMGRADESGTITASQLTFTLRNDGRFTPKNASAPAPYLNNILRNTQIRIRVNTSSAAGVIYSGFRYFGEIAAWPPGYDISQRDSYVQVTASGIWRRISQGALPIGSAFSRYTDQLAGVSAPQAWWAMEDGNGSTGFVPGTGTGAGVITGTPSFSADGTSFAGSDALAQFNNARITFPVSGGTPTNNVIRFALSVPAGGDSNAEGGNWNIVQVNTAGTFAMLEVYLIGDGTLQFDGVSSGGTILFTTRTTTNVQGKPLLVSCELVPSGGSVSWALNIITPGSGAVLESKTGTRGLTTIGAVSSVSLNRSGTLSDTTLGQLSVTYASVPSLVIAASALGGFSGEFAVARFQRLCSEFSITAAVIGSASAAMGPQADDTLPSLLQSIEDTDGGLLTESRDQFGLTYRTLASMQDQASALTLNHAAGVLGAPLQPAYDDQLLRNSWLVTNTDGYVSQAQLTSGAISVQPVPSGVGLYSAEASTNAASHAQVDAIAKQRLFLGTTDEVRFPSVTVNFLRANTGPQFAVIPALRIGDHFQISNLPAFLGGGTTKQVAWGYTETLGGDPEAWTISFNTIPEVAFETAFSPGVFAVTQAPVQGTAQGSGVGSSVAGSQFAPGSIPASALARAISARTIGGITSFVSAATPYDWVFTVTGTPADKTYFTCTTAQAQPIGTGDTFSNSGGLGGPFTVTSVDPPAAGLVTVHFTPDASGVMSSGTVTGGKNGDTWINTSAGNQVNQWAAGAWVPVTWNAANVITAGSITASQIAAGTVIAGIVDATTITGAQFVAIGTSGEILIYSGTPAAGNLIGAWSGLAGSDAFGNAYAAGISAFQFSAFQPGSSPTVAETWHSLGSYPSGTTSRGRYRITPENELELDINLTGTPSAGTGSFPNTLPAAYRPAVTKRYVIAQGGTLGIATIATTGVVSMTIGAGGSSTADLTVRVALD